MTAAPKPAKSPAKEPKPALQCPSCVYATGNLPAFVKHLMQVHALRRDEISQIVEHIAKGKS